MSKPQRGQPHRFDSDEARENQAKSTGEQQRLRCPQCGLSVGNLPLHLKRGWCGDE